MKNLYITSDQHFFHQWQNIIKYCNRPFKTYTDMNKKIIDNYNEIIKPDDNVIHLGDLSAGIKNNILMFKDILNSLNGNKILLKGNHDYQNNQFYLDNGFKVVGDHMILGDYFLSHYPLETNSKWSTKVEKRLLEIYNNSKCTKIIHGHTHNNVKKWKDNKFRINACVDVNDYKPILLHL